MHSVGGVGEELEPGLNHESWGGGWMLPHTGVFVTWLWSLAPYLVLATQAPSESSSWVAVGPAWKVAPTGPGYSLACLPVQLLCACCSSPDGSGRNATLVNWRELLPGGASAWGLCGKLLMEMVCPNTLFQREWV